MSTLYIVATPIGNLEDITLRALRILGEVDFILCEDTRITRRLLEHYKISTPTVSYHQHSDINKTDYVLDLLAKGKSLALVSDAGTPGISDPGGKLVQAVIEKFGTEDEDGFGAKKTVQIESVPGPSAVTAALSISGIPTDKFVFLGFPPHKKGRKKFLLRIFESDYPVVIYESKHRIIKFLEELKSLAEEMRRTDAQTVIREKPYRKAREEKKKKKEITSVVVCRELSKMHETVYRGEMDNIISQIKDNPNDQKGEFVVIIA